MGREVAAYCGYGLVLARCGRVLNDRDNEDENDEDEDKESVTEIVSNVAKKHLIALEVVEFGDSEDIAYNSAGIIIKINKSRDSHVTETVDMLEMDTISKLIDYVKEEKVKNMFKELNSKLSGYKVRGPGFMYGSFCFV